MKAALADSNDDEVDLGKWPPDVDWKWKQQSASDWNTLRVFWGWLSIYGFIIVENRSSGSSFSSIWLCNVQIKVETSCSWVLLMFLMINSFTIVFCSAKKNDDFSTYLNGEDENPLEIWTWTYITSKLCFEAMLQ